MKYNYITIILLTCFQFSGYSQDFWGKLRQERQQNRLENRKTNDPIYTIGDTLYLLYDQSDTLQAYYPKREMVCWKLREMTPQETQSAYASEWNDLFLSKTAIEFHLFPLEKTDPSIQTSDNLKEITLTSRKVFMDFFEREYKRLEGKTQSTSKEEDLYLSEWDLCNYFVVSYMLIPKTDGKIDMYTISRERKQ